MSRPMNGAVLVAAGVHLPRDYVRLNVSALR